MAITYVWDITSLHCDTDVNLGCDAVKTAHWTLAGTDGTYTGLLQGEVSLNLLIVPSEGQTTAEKFATLTKEEVITAIQDALGTEQVTLYENIVAEQIQQQIAPTSTTPTLPWLA